MLLNPWDRKANKIKNRLLANSDFFDIKYTLADHAAKLLFGQGVRLTSDDENINNFLQDVAKKNKLDRLLMQVAREVSYGGYAIITIDKNKAGELLLSYIGNEMFQDIERFEVTPYSARFLRKRVLGQKIYFITENWSQTAIQRTIKIQTEKDAGPRDINVKKDGLVPKEFDLPVYEKHNLGFVPFVLITNKPCRNEIISQFTERLQDDYPVRNIAKFINTAYQQWFAEMFKGASKVFGNFGETDKAQLKAQNSDPTIDDFLIRANSLGGTGATKLVEIMQASYSSDPWTNTIKSNINFYYFGSGYAKPFPEVKDPTVPESLISKDDDIRTPKEQRRNYQEMLDELICKLLVYNKMAKDLDSAMDLFILEIKENVIYNQQQLGEHLANNVANGFMTKADAIALMFDISIDDAKEKVKEIEKEQETERAKMVEYQNNLGTTSGDPTGDADPNSSTGGPNTRGVGDDL